MLTNADLERMVETTDEWILQRTGIRERHIVDPGVATSDLAAEAAREAIATGRPAARPTSTLIIVGTTTPDTIFPSTACLLQHKIGATRAWGFDLGAACSGFTYALATAAQFIATGVHKHALVVGADVMSSIIDYTDRTTCVLFGDGAGAVVLSAGRPRSRAARGIIDFAAEIDGSGGPALCMPAGGSRMPASHETVDQRLHYVHQDGQTVFKFAVRKTEEICRRLLERNGLAPGDIDLLVSHQANRRIIQLGRREARHRSGPGGHQHREVRQHHRRHHPAGAGRRAARRPPAARPPGDADVGRRRVHSRRRPAPLGRHDTGERARHRRRSRSGPSKLDKRQPQGRLCGSAEHTCARGMAQIASDKSI